ncbi:hypothetical protein [Phyllobacterium bourgognense]|nr:hypothetical protein [Phyllobacterium bourgognense]
MDHCSVPANVIRYVIAESFAERTPRPNDLVADFGRCSVAFIDGSVSTA